MYIHLKSSYFKWIYTMEYLYIFFIIREVILIDNFRLKELFINPLPKYGIFIGMLIWCIGFLLIVSKKLWKKCVWLCKSINRNNKYYRIDILNIIVLSVNSKGYYSVLWNSFEYLYKLVLFLDIVPNFLFLFCKKILYFNFSEYITVHEKW